MMRVVRRFAGYSLIVALGLLAACTSAPTRFYTLVPARTNAAPTKAAPYQIDLLPVTIPAAVDRPELMIRQSNDRVALIEGDRWIAPLGQQIRNAVAAQLQMHLGASNVYGLVPTHDKPVYRIHLIIRRFESVPGQFARIVADWSVRGPHDNQALSCSSTVKQPVEPGYDALVRGHQQALAALSNAIATVVNQLATQGKAACPLP